MKLQPLICMILSSSRYLSKSSWQNLKKEECGTQSSSKIIASSTCSNTQEIPVAGRTPHPRLLSEKEAETLQGQSTKLTSARVVSHNFLSSELFSRGPSAIMKRRSGAA